MSLYKDFTDLVGDESVKSLIWGVLRGFGPMIMP